MVRRAPAANASATASADSSVPAPWAKSSSAGGASSGLSSGRIRGLRVRSATTAAGVSAEAAPVIDRCGSTCTRFMPRARASAWRQIPATPEELRLKPGIDISHFIQEQHTAVRQLEALVRISESLAKVRIDDTVRDLRERIAPRIVAPGHCTGWRAKAALAAEFAPGRDGPSVVGSRYVLAAE